MQGAKLKLMKKRVEPVISGLENGIELFRDALLLSEICLEGSGVELASRHRPAPGEAVRNAARHAPESSLCLLAEREGFEPSVRY